MKLSKTVYEDFASFAEQPSRDRFKTLMRRNLGETDLMDFKSAWIETNVLARHILAIANSGGGCIVIGVLEDNTGSVSTPGIDKFLDKADLSKGLAKFLPEQLEYDLVNLEYKDSDYKDLAGKKFQIVLIEYTSKYLPFVSRSGGEKGGAIKNRIYIRRGTNSEEANYRELQELLNVRLETNYSSRGEFNLERELDELKAIYREARYRIPYGEHFELTSSSGVENEWAPDITYDQFVYQLIIAKSQKIRVMTLGSSMAFLGEDDEKEYS